MATLFAPIFEILPISSSLPTWLIAGLVQKFLNVQMIFAEAKRMLQFDAPIFVEDKFDNHGKWMDGWETRRKRHAGYDWAIVKLG